MVAVRLYKSKHPGLKKHPYRHNGIDADIKPVMGTMLALDWH